MINRIMQYIGYKLISKSESKIPIPNLQGDRDIEWSFIAAHIPDGSGNILDFGSGGSNLGLIAALKNYNVTAIDLSTIEWAYTHPNLQFILGDLFDLSLQEHKYDLIINCSTVEHVGLAGRYNISKSNPDGDIDAMDYLKKLMTPQGRMLLTIPVGKDAIFAPLHRVYGEIRLLNLLKGYNVEHEMYWIKNNKNQWIIAEKSEALIQEASPHFYGLGCFVLRGKQC